MNKNSLLAKNPWCVLLLAGLGLMVACFPLLDTGLSHASNYNSLVLKIQTNRSQIHVGESIKVHFSITNEGKHPAMIETHDKPVMDIIVQGVESQEVWHSWSEQNPPKVSNRIEWQPGETKEIELLWVAPPEEKGRRVFVGGLLSADLRVVQSANVTIVILPPSQ